MEAINGGNKMKVILKEVGIESLQEYAQVPIALEVNSIYVVDEVDEGLGGLKLKEESVNPAYIKDYDASAGESPLNWPEKFDLGNSGLFLAQVEGITRGAAAVFFRNPEIRMLEGREDLAVLWDIRVDTSFRGLGIGRSLFQYSARWAGEKGSSLLKVETQNINVGACKFYKKMGCRLGIIHRYAYLDYPEEVMLVWYLDL